MNAKLVLTNILTLLALAAILVFGQGGGPLVPPGPPGSAGTEMIAINTAEPRTPLVEGAPTTSAVITSNSDYHFVINQPGSYFLADNLTVSTKANGILIGASGVTLDLMGFEVRRSGSPGTGDGIRIHGAADLCSVENGTIQEFERGIASDNGAGLVGSRGTSIRDLRIGNCAEGIRAGVAWAVRSCSVYQCTDGIRAGPESHVVDCIVDDFGDRGIHTSTNCVIARCSATGADAAHEYGIFTGATCTVTDCIVELPGSGGSGIRVASHALVTGCSVDQGDIGIEVAGSGCRIQCSVASGASSVAIDLSGTKTAVRNCSIAGSPTVGISVNAANCSITENTSDGKIDLNSTGTIVESNHLLATDFGIDGTDGAGNVITRNTILATDTAIVEPSPIDDYFSIPYSLAPGINSWPDEPWSNLKN